MRNILNRLTLTRAGFVAGALIAAAAAHAGTELDFSNPAVTLSGDAVIASGTCIAHFTAVLDDRTKAADEIGQKVAERCSREIARSAGLASYMVGKPEEYAKNLKYTREDLTTNAVLRYRATTHQRAL